MADAAEPVVLDEARFRAVFNRLEPYIEATYGIPVVIADVTDPFTGDLDGAEIRVDYDQSAEDALFIIAHLFGHTVQWNLSERARVIGSVVENDPSPELLDELEEYERVACRYSLRLFHDCGITDLDQWLSDFAACDFAYLRHFYSTKEKRPFRSFWLKAPRSSRRWTSRPSRRAAGIRAGRHRRLAGCCKRLSSGSRSSGCAQPAQWRTRKRRLGATSASS